MSKELLTSSELISFITSQYIPFSYAMDILESIATVQNIIRIYWRSIIKNNNASIFILDKQQLLIFHHIVLGISRTD